MAVGDWFRLIIESSQASGLDVAINGLAFRQANALVLDEEGEDLIQAWESQAETLYASLMTSSYAIRKLTVRGLTTPSYIFESSTKNVPGTSGGDALPPQVAPLISLRTGIAGRSNRGRIYMPPTAESHSVLGVMQTTYTDTAADFMDQLLPLVETLATATWELGVWSPTLNQGRPVTSYLIRQLIATQRRRKTGIGG